MEVNAYYEEAHFATQEQQQHLLSNTFANTEHSAHNMLERHYSTAGQNSLLNSAHSSPLKPLQLVTNMDNHGHNFDDYEHVKATQREDELLKAKIRRLRLLTRIIAFAISIGVFVPIALTLHKFITTQNVYHDVVHPDGTVQSRTAWAKDSKVWPTWMYFLVAAIALLLNLCIILAYLFSGVKGANRAAVVATTFTWIVMIGNLVVWAVAASLYRTEKDKDGKSNDLWGWTCSSAAQAIQKEFKNEVDFDKFCNVQSISWYIGLVQVAAAILTVVTYVLVIMRRKTQKKIQKQTHLSRGF